MSIVTFTTDFGLQDSFVAEMKGIILSEKQSVQIVDNTHFISPQNILEASLKLSFLPPVFPNGTVHVCVVDPGVGSEREILLLKADGQYFIAPDNGVLSHVYFSSEEKEIRYLKTDLFETKESPTFHGRDLMAPAAVRLIGNYESFYHLSTPAERCELLEKEHPKCEGNKIEGRIVSVDAFGNVMTNIRSSDIPEGKQIQFVTISSDASQKIPFQKYFSEVSIGEDLSYFESHQYLELATRNGSFAHKNELKSQSKILITANLA